MAATAKVLDFNQPDAAKNIGGELSLTTQSLVKRLGVHAAILDLSGLEQAVEDRRQIGDAIKRVEEFFAPFKDMAYKLHKALCTRESDILNPLKFVDAHKRTSISDYKAEQDRVRAAHERELAEQQRVAQQTAAAAEAAALELSGDHAMAAAVMEEAIAAPMPIAVLPDETKAVEGLKFRREWKWRYPGGTGDAKTSSPASVTRTMSLIPREFLRVDEQKVSAHVRAMKGSAKIPGLEIFYTDTPVR